MQIETSESTVGTITQIIGPVMDISFPVGKMPNIYNSLVVEGSNQAGQELKVVCEVQQLLGDNMVRAISMSATDGLMRGMTVKDTGAPLSVPVGESTLGRIFNVLGEPVDELGSVDSKVSLPIHRKAPAFVDLDTNLSIFETGIKVVDLLAPYRRGGKIGLFGGAGVDSFEGDAVLGSLGVVVHRGVVKPVAPEYLGGQVAGPHLDGAAGVGCRPLQRDDDLRLAGGQVPGRV